MKIPVTVITGFLGSGKSTLLNHVLRAPAMADSAIIINEFGEIPIDHLLIESAFENMVVLENGCICCTVRGDLVDTLSDLLARAKQGEIPAFSRVVIETTGMADVAPILQTLLFDAALARDFELAATVTTVDAVNGSAQLKEFSEAVRQAALADVIALTKCDIADPAAARALEAELKALNPTARLLRVANGAIDIGLFLQKIGALRAGAADVRNWLEFEPEEDHHGHEHRHVSRHDANILTFCIVEETPIPLPVFKTWLQSITSLRGSDLLRVKGIVNIAGLPGPVLVQGVQHILHPPVTLPAWPDADRRTRLVFITRNIPKAALMSTLAAA